MMKLLTRGIFVLGILLMLVPVLTSMVFAIDTQDESADGNAKDPLITEYEDYTGDNVSCTSWNFGGNGTMYMNWNDVVHGEVEICQGESYIWQSEHAATVEEVAFPDRCWLIVVDKVDKL